MIANGLFYFVNRTQNIGASADWRHSILWRTSSRPYQPILGSYPVGDEQRRQHRIGVSLELHVAGTDQGGIAFEEMTHSNDVSRGGCSFHTAHEMAVGAEIDIEVIRHIAKSQSNFQTRGLVVRIATDPPAGFLAAVRFIGPQFPTYSRESTI